MKFSDIKLSEADLAEIEAKILEHSENVYGGEMSSHSKATLRQKLIREMKEGIWSDRDYTEADEGEPPKGVVW
jgi:hypothetical protein